MTDQGESRDEIVDNHAENASDRAVREADTSLPRDPDFEEAMSAVKKSRSGPADESESGDATPRVSAEKTDGALRARVRRLEEENERLREQYAGARQSRYERTAFWLAVVGLTFGAAGVIISAAQEVLFALAATGVFAAVLTYFLTPERLIPLDIGEGIYTALADNEASIADQLGLSTTQVYLVTDRGPRLFIPEIDSYDRSILEADEELASPLVVGDTASRSGLSLRPAGEPLLRTFKSQHGGSLPSKPAETASILGEGITNALELAAAVNMDLDAEDGRVTFEIDDPLYGNLTHFDHPIRSFIGTGLAVALNTPVELEIGSQQADGTGNLLVTYRWDSGRVGARGGSDTPD